MVATSPDLRVPGAPYDGLAKVCAVELSNSKATTGSSPSTHAL
jgi:hypothetical protein